MRVLLSTIGSRGDVQPLVALGLHLRALGHDVRLCVPPDFAAWIASLGFQVTPIGPHLRAMATASPAAGPPTPAQRRQMIEDTVATQFETIAAAAAGCELIVGATALQIAAPSVAERLRVPYVFVAYCPAVLPSSHHAPPVLGTLGDTPQAADSGALWRQDARRWNESWAAPLNARRAALGLAPVADVRGHVLTDRPWLAADPTLAPWPEPADPAVVQTGAWLVEDQRPLAPELEAFLAAGPPPVFFGFGSLRAPHDLASVMVSSARALRRRAIVARGWAGLSLAADAPDCLVVDEVNQRALFKRVAAVVHHGGAGTTTTAALAGVPQVIIPQLYDQHYWARRVHQLGIGCAHAPGAPTTDSLTQAVAQALQPEVAERAQAVGALVRTDGAATAAHRLVARQRQAALVR